MNDYQLAIKEATDAIRHLISLAESDHPSDTNQCVLCDGAWDGYRIYHNTGCVIGGAVDWIEYWPKYQFPEDK